MAALSQPRAPNPPRAKRKAGSYVADCDTEDVDFGANFGSRPTGVARRRGPKKCGDISYHGAKHM